ncbi:MAG TPA: hypothetical protein VHN98_05300 [Acidimicrobiales bacterium]|nr:hypothetical protein [Acidimicrobiales bacterium]
MTGAAGSLVLLVVFLVSDAWVYLDARASAQRGEPVVASFGRLSITTPETWLLACALVWVVFLPAYVVARRY